MEPTEYVTITITRYNDLIRKELALLTLAELDSYNASATLEKIMEVLER